MDTPLVHHLHYAWTGWPTEGTTLPILTTDFINAIRPAWQADGLHPILVESTTSHVHITVQASPTISPVTLAARLKGRLQHALRKEGRPVDFSRKVSVRALAHNTRPVVEAYLRLQSERADLADPRYRQSLREAWREDASIDLSRPSETSSGRYWYDLHAVLVTADRYRFGAEHFLPRVRDELRQAAQSLGARIKAIAPMPDHVHLVMRGALEKSPAEMLQPMAEITARSAGFRLWGEVYAGTVGEYSLDLILA